NTDIGQKNGFAKSSNNNCTPTTYHSYLPLANKKTHLYLLIIYCFSLIRTSTVEDIIYQSFRLSLTQLMSQ
ncbi:MAG TPA: hypothetical protein VKA34_02830, partial [Balneolales bacterium]|nr:hypothetical protein [Balneolales bacterium]